MLVFPILRKRFVVGLVNVNEAIRLVNQNQGIWIDLRKPEQFKEGHIIQARNMLLSEIKKKGPAFFKSKILILVCANGSDSSRATAQLRDSGFLRTVALDGGMNTWNQFGFPITRKG